MPSRNDRGDKRADSPDDGVTEFAHDFLEDPSLWLDRLPQPFRMIDEVLSSLFETAWQSIQRREAERRLQRSRVQLPEFSCAETVVGTEGARAVACGRKGVVYVATASALSVYGRDGASFTKLLQQDASLEGEEELSKLAVGCCSRKVTFVAALAGHSRVLVFAHFGDHLILVNQATPQVEGSRISAIFLSPTASHLSLSVPPASPEDGPVQLEVLRLPLDSWSKELESYTEQGLQSESQLSVGSRKKERQEASYSKLVYQFSLQPPRQLAASAAKDPSTALQNVVDASSEYLATGHHHILTQRYFDNRRKAFVSHRADFASEEAPVISFNDSTPIIHYLYYNETGGARHSSPGSIAVWWSRHSQLFIYSLEAPPSTKAATGVAMCRRVLPQSADIVASTVSLDSELLALALSTGVVTVWNTKSGLCVKVVSAVPASEPISSVEFLPGQALLAVGTSHGRVLLVSCGSTSLGAPRVEHGQSVLTLRLNPALPATVLSVHADGCLVVWSSRETRGLCRVVLPSSLGVMLGDHCCCTSNGQHLMVLAKPITAPQDGSSCEAILAAFDLSSVDELQREWKATTGIVFHPLWREEEEVERGMLVGVQRTLVDFTKRKMERMGQKHWQHRWAQFSQELLLHS